MCICCNNATTEVFKIKNRGYGSLFDLMQFEIPLCDSCIRKFDVKKEWFVEKQSIYKEYTYEIYIINLIRNIVDKHMF